MKKRIGLVVASVAVLAVGTQAAIIAQDDFSYADGALTGQSGGSGFSDAWSTAFGTGNHIESGVAQSQGTGGNIRTLNSEWGSSGTVWFTFDFGTSVDQNTFAGLSFFADTNGDVGRTERVLIGDRSGADVWGIAFPSGGFSNSSLSTEGYKTGVGRITLGASATSSIDLWVGANAVDAVDISGASDATLTGLQLEDVTQVRFAAGADTYSYDNFILGDTYTDVGAIPEPATLGLLGVFGGGLLFIRRRFMN
ncbi:MAG: PEP-CTERM sorting domain-containing protein [Pontiella sp.]